MEQGDGTSGWVGLDLWVFPPISSILLQASQSSSIKQCLAGQIRGQTMSVLKHCCSVSGASVTLVQQMSNIAWVSFDLQEHKIHLLWNIY